MKKELDASQQLIASIAGKLFRDFFNEDYLKCDCPVCTKMKKIHKKSEPYVNMVTQLVNEEKKVDKTK